MTQKIFRSILLIVTAVLLLSFSIVTAVLYNNFEKNQSQKLENELILAMQGVELNGIKYLQTLDDSEIRLTWVSQDGTVLYDTDADAAVMESHSQREEIYEALNNGVGESSRYSDTVTQKMLYRALRLSDGTVLRIALGVDTVFSLLFDALLPVSLVFVVAVAVSVLAARRTAKSIVEPLNRLDLEKPYENDTYEELLPVLAKIGNQHQEISRQMELLRRKTDEFEQIIGSMNEGLVLLDEDKNILSMNKAARKIFSAEGNNVGKCFLTVDRSPETAKAIENALSGKRGEFRRAQNGSEFQFDVSRIEFDGKTLGAVILAFDITDKAFAERNRREFTANVSHELKTPLQSIIGSAELLENGLVKPEDAPRFIGNIKNEASRMVSLINDIIRLSQLDENSSPATETVDIYEVAQEVIRDLTPSAEPRNIALALKGEHMDILGVRRYIYEIIYNLCDNAIRYNVNNGSVEISLQKINGRTCLSVSDTGIGIAPEHHGRIFERFYRVDKSHSRETGGTGLGLSIVKHAVMYHGGTLNMKSEQGKGTRVEITF